VRCGGRKRGGKRRRISVFVAYTQRNRGKNNEKTDKLSNAESRRKYTNRFREDSGEMHGQGREGMRSGACGRLVVSVFDVCRCMIVYLMYVGA